MGSIPATARDELRPLLPPPVSRADIKQDGSNCSSRHRLLLACSLAALLAISVLFFFDSTFGRQQHVKVIAAKRMTEANSYSSMSYQSTPSSSSHQHTCAVKPLPSFSSYLSNSNPTNPKPYNVTYNSRSIIINGEPTILMSGSMHPVRATKSTWSTVLDLAVKANLNMITIYLMWGYHQPNPYEDIDWSLPSGSEAWDVATAIWEAARRGLYVHIRIGPYVCAEYTYGGIPEWVPMIYGGDTDDSRMSMRRPNQQWMNAMKAWVDASVAYLTSNGLFAYQGGPIILAQIENELGGDVDPSTENILPNKTLQDYADWCGDLAYQAQPNVIWTMCNGLSSERTINTCNGYGEGGSCSTTWLEQHGQSGRIQIDMPALWTESEMGFQIWGDDPTNTTDYFWGRTARDVAGDVLRWFARGGTHLNTYMFWGGYNRGRMAASGITNAYATDALVCPNGEPRQPKFDHLTAMHNTIAKIARVLVLSPTALGKEISLDYRNITEEHTKWEKGTKQLAFRYNTEIAASSSVLFLENNDPRPVDVRVPSGSATKGENKTVIRMEAFSATIIVDGNIIFSSTNVNNRALSYRRKTVETIPLTEWSSWMEPRGAGNDNAITDTRPIEQTRLLLACNASTDHIWYDTFLKYDGILTGAVSLSIETQRGSAVTVFVNDEYAGDANNHEHADGDLTLNITFFPKRRLSRKIKLQFLFESFGYGNLMGRWGANSSPKTKGITGNVWLVGTDTGSENGTAYARHVRICLTCGQLWHSQAGLQGRNDRKEKSRVQPELAPPDVAGQRGIWLSSEFRTPPSLEFCHDRELMLRILDGRGEIWLNDVSLGRYWNITRWAPSSEKYSQEYYHLPRDLLNRDKNRLVFFNVLGGEASKSTSIVATKIEKSDRPNFADEVDFAHACL